MLGTSTDDCDSEMLTHLNMLAPNDEEKEEPDTDSRWDKLKDLMNNKN
jgi:uncharacterized metal-binding protein YceD (DUF177 family)